MLLVLLALLAVLLIAAISLSGHEESVSSDEALIASEAAVPSETVLPPLAPAVAATSLQSPTTDSGGSPLVLFAGWALPSPSSPSNTGPAPAPPAPLAPGGITGTVTGEELAPIPAITVYLADASGNLTGASVSTDGAGRFGFSDLAPGEYRLFFSDPAGNYQPGWYGGKSGSVVKVVPAVQTQVAFTMTLISKVLSRISGTVTDEAGKPVAGVEVLAYAVQKPDIQLGLRGVAITDAAGSYMISGLAPLAGPPGADSPGYKVLFRPDEKQFAYQWYHGAPNPDQAELLPLFPGETVGKVNAALTAGGTISGTVTLDGKPAPASFVDVFDASDLIVSTVLVDAGGHYQTRMLPEGEYRVRASGAGLTTMWYDGATSIAGATAVAVAAGKVSGGIDISLKLLLPPPETDAALAAREPVSSGSRRQETGLEAAAVDEGSAMLAASSAAGRTSGTSAPAPPDGCRASSGQEHDCGGSAAKDGTACSGTAAGSDKPAAGNPDQGGGPAAAKDDGGVTPRCGPAAANDSGGVSPRSGEGVRSESLAGKVEDFAAADEQQKQIFTQRRQQETVGIKVQAGEPQAARRQFLRQSGS